MSGREEREPAGDVFFAEREGFAGEENERVEDGAPGDLVVVDRIVEMARADGVFARISELDWRPRSRAPSRQRAWRSSRRPTLRRRRRRSKRLWRRRLEDLAGSG